MKQRTDDFCRPLTAILSLVVCLFLTPISLQAAAPYSDMAVGDEHACGLESDGTIYCESSALGKRYLPPIGVQKATAITAGEAHTCAINFDGNIFCWGENAYGQLDVPTLATPIRSIDAGDNHTCAIDANGSVTCWGLNSNERLNTPFSSRVYNRVSTRNAYTCAVTDSGVPECYTAMSALENTQPPAYLTNIQQIEAVSRYVYNFACALDVAGSIECWGHPISNTPVFSNGPYLDIALNESIGCAVEQTGKLDCRLLQNGSAAAFAIEAQPTGTNFVAVEDGTGNEMCVLDAAGEMMCWGHYYDEEPFSTSRLAMVEVPTELSASIYSDNTVELFWKQIHTRQTHYQTFEIFRNDILVATTDNGSSYTDDGLEPGTEYHYQIRAVDRKGRATEFSESLRIQTRSFINPGPVESYVPPARPYETTALTAEVYWENTVELFWDRVSAQVFGYEIRRDGEFVGFTQGISYIDQNGIQAGKSFDYDVIAVDRNGNILGLDGTRVSIGVNECTH